MTYILNAPRLKTSNRPIAGIPVARIASKAGALATDFGTRALHIGARIPAAISAAFAMAYVSPYRPSRQDKDPSDPANF